jgi:hypothetical protein
LQPDRTANGMIIDEIDQHVRSPPATLAGIAITPIIRSMASAESTCAGSISITVNIMH